MKRVIIVTDGTSSGNPVLNVVGPFPTKRACDRCLARNEDHMIAWDMGWEITTLAAPSLFNRELKEQCEQAGIRSPKRMRKP